MKTQKIVHYFTLFYKIQMGSENSAKKGSVHVNENEDTDRVYYITGGFRQSRPILKGKDAKKTFDSIPTIDVANVFSPDLGLRKAVAKEVAKAAEEVGFFYAANPPVSTQKIGKKNLNKLW